jgi:hypothetical protein
MKRFFTTKVNLIIEYTKHPENDVSYFYDGKKGEKQAKQDAIYISNKDKDIKQVTIQIKKELKG